MKVNRNKKVLFKKKDILKFFPYFEKSIESIEKTITKGEKFNINKMGFKLKYNKRRLSVVAIKIKYKKIIVEMKLSKGSRK
ncbi:hypothetical protein [Fusobacterium ulcerans]